MLAMLEDKAFGVVRDRGIVVVGLYQAASVPEAHYAVARLLVDTIFPASFDD